MPFEDGEMVRAIPAAGPGTLAGPPVLVAKWGDFVDYESVLEPKWLTLLDFDPQVTAFVTQPMEFEAIDAQGSSEPCLHRSPAVDPGRRARPAASRNTDAPTGLCTRCVTTRRGCGHIHPV